MIYFLDLTIKEKKTCLLRIKLLRQDRVHKMKYNTPK